ncbi:MAG: gliding motility-associated C-terminal domain-containing protein [Bacteroidales bacterium]|nr:gliding motility-associated C-terminal domain-containing protein [Bacteroidales bacterium]
MTNMFSQLSSGSAGAERTISYKTYTGSDKVFIFYAPPGENVRGSLRADAPQPGLFNFDWTAFNPGLSSWGPVFKSETGVDFSLASDLAEGGYRVQVSNGADVDTFFYGWVFINNLLVDVEETPEGNVKPFKYTCDFLILNGAVYPDSFFYYDPVSYEKIELLNGFSFLWTSDNPDLIIPNPTRVLNPNTNYRPPVIDTWFILTATDSFGMQDVDSVFYETIHVRSEFSFEFFDKEESKDFIAAPNPTEADAPLKVRFTNESVNGYSFEWIYEDTTMADLFANEFTEDVNYQPEYIYKIPDDYYPRLVATSEEGCIDTFKVEDPIIIIPSELEAPNVFSPEGLEANRYFKVKFKSIKEFHIRIYSRTGNLVYKADVTDMYGWEGWDGNIMNSNRPAQPGVYYYVIEATGYDEVRYNRGPYKGAVHLFRGRD